MSDHVDNAVNDTKPENPRGPRARYYICIAGSGKKILYERIQAEDEAEARSLFQEKTNTEATIVDAAEGKGFYIAKGTGISSAQKVSVTVTPAQLMSRTSNAYQGEFKGWHVWASGLQACTVKDVDYADNELVSIEFDKRVDPNSGVDKPKIKKKEVIRLSDLENVSAM